jgi:DNA-binding protein HU-beta
MNKATPKNINKAIVIEQMAKVTKLQKTTCKDCLEAFIDIVRSTLKQNKSIVLTGFGTFSVMQRKKRTGVNPSTGAKMIIPAKKVPKFKAGKALKDLID